MKEFYARGKLLLMGEYYVLLGAKALAIPVKRGQKLQVRKGNEPSSLIWKTPWMQVTFNCKENLSIVQCEEKFLLEAKKLLQLLNCCLKYNPLFIHEIQGAEVDCLLEFPRSWGLGSSSSLVSNLAEWAKIDAYSLLQETWGGSGYDLAAAHRQGAYLYSRFPTVQVQDLSWIPPHPENFTFVYLGNKQGTQQAVEKIFSLLQDNSALIPEIDQLTNAFIRATSIDEIKNIILASEELISGSLKLKRAKDLYFADFFGEVKSLGAWGGDFVLLVHEAEESAVQAYLQQKGMSTFFAFKDLAMVQGCGQ